MPTRPPIHKPMPWRKQEPKRAESFYSSPEWKAFRKQVLIERDYTCCECGARSEKGMHVDHKKPIREGGAKLSRDNVQVLCPSGHSSKTAINDRARNEDGSFAVSQQWKKPGLYPIQDDGRR